MKLGINHTLLLVVLLSGIPCSTAAQIPQVGDSDAPSANTPPANSWENVGKPGVEHEKLSRLVGNWNVVLQNWSEPNAAPQKSTGRARKEFILGGRYLKEDFEGTLSGKPFNGLGFIGYDKAAGEYSTFWIDSASTNMAFTSGQFDGTGNTLINMGRYKDVQSGKSRRTRMVTRIVSKDLHIVEMYEVDMRPEFKTVEIVYQRR